VIFLREDLEISSETFYLFFCAHVTFCDFVFFLCDFCVCSDFFSKFVEDFFELLTPRASQTGSLAARVGKVGVQNNTFYVKKSVSIKSLLNCVVGCRESAEERKSRYRF